MKKRTSYFLPRIDAMEGYAPGEQPKLPDLVKLNTNESPFPPAPGVSKALAGFEAARLRLYPDPVADAVRAELAAQFCPGVSADNVIAGNGSDDILNIAVRCFCDAERPVAFLDPSYSLYPTLAGLQGAEMIRIPLKEDFSLPDDLLSRAERANLLIITRPNAPTGNLFPRAEMERICAGFDGIVLIDEAYADFSDDNCADFAVRFPNVIVARTFSKSRCLAGLRFGYAVADRTVIAGMMKMKDSYNVSMLAQILALESLRDRPYFEECVRRIRATRERLADGLRGLGFRVIPSQTNFLFAEPPDGDGGAYFAKLRERSIIVRYFKGDVTGRFVRITVGTDEQADRLLNLSAELYR